MNSTYAFDGHSLRTIKVVGAGRTWYLHAGTELIAEFEDAASATYQPRPVSATAADPQPCARRRPRRLLHRSRAAVTLWSAGALLPLCPARGRPRVQRQAKALDTSTPVAGVLTVTSIEAAPR